jgi:hypothetical protein
MTLQIQRSFFSGLAGAMDDLKDLQLWPTTYSTRQIVHAEGEINVPVTLIIGVSEPLTPDLFLLTRDPAAL